MVSVLVQLGGGVSHAEVSKVLENTVSDGWGVLSGGKLTTPRKGGDMAVSFLQESKMRPGCVLRG